ncbi:ImmA/IrrE family metallo-endopeptidase [Pseudoclavibacter helvolus]|uniref:ImmA/IrrE family metallo-endopeptidase n=1 Tax=Pseudoclavibacter helvolus TaxID=255205 RepID=UPI0008392D47|nr:ImmA/IrrE family metallo-endopeptidase [Pseudoclavibacter helvolus]
MIELAEEERKSLGLSHRDQLDPYALCEEHGVEVYPLSRVASTEAVAHFTTSRTSTWSAALIPVGSARVIVENDNHLPVRRRSNIGHELGHFLLEHEFQTELIGGSHERQFDATLEKQATFLAGELLVPSRSVEQMAFKGWSNAQVAAAFGVSEQFAQMRMYGQRIRAARASARFGGQRLA